MRWKKVPNFPNYEVSNFGHLRRDGHLLKAQKTKHGANRKHVRYHYSLSNRGKVTNLGVAFLVLSAFKGPRPSKKHYALHRDDDQSNNHIRNLYWGTQQQNVDDMLRNGKGTAGSKNGYAAFTNSQVNFIRKSKLTSIALSQQLGVHVATVYRVRHNRTYTNAS